MTGPSLSSATLTRLEKAALDNGFDRDLGRDGEWRHFGSSFAPMGVWLSGLGAGTLVVALSRSNVAGAVEPELGGPWSGVLPSGAVAACVVPDFARVELLLRRCYQLARTLPDELFHEFERQTASLPRATEVERLVVQRVGQDIFRAGLMEYWDGRCAVTGLAIPELLRASHIKPWAVCTSDAERLDVFNGLLLAPHLDAAFDRGFITIGGSGEVVASTRLDSASRHALGLDGPLRVSRSITGHARYLAWHHENMFGGQPS